MFDLIAENSGLRLLLLLLLFAMVAVVTYFATQAIGERQLARRRLLDQDPGPGGATQTLGSLRTDKVQSAWLKLVNSIEKSGLSLVDSKDEALRQKLAAAGFKAAYAPRVYTLLRLVLVIALPAFVLLLLWATGSSPGIGKIYVTLVIAAGLGLYVPSLLVRIRAERRQRELVNGFPGKKVDICVTARRS